MVWFSVHNSERHAKTEFRIDDVDFSKKKYFNSRIVYNDSDYDSDNDS